MFLDVKFPDAYNISNTNDDDDIDFLKLFEQKYSAKPVKYTYIAYNIMMDFCSDFSYFKFEDVTDGGKVNTHVPLHHYVDYELISVE